MVSKIYLLWNIWYLLGQSITVFIILEFNFCILSENSHKMKWRVSSFQGPIYYCMFGTVKEGWIDRSKHLLKGDYLSHLIFTITWWGNWRSERLTDFPKVFHLITAVQVCSFYFHLNFPTAIQPIIKSYIQIFLKFFLMLEREEGRGGREWKRERERNMGLRNINCLPPVCTPR